MPAPTFTQDDLLLSPDETSQLHVALVNFGQGDPIATAIAEATATVSLYTSRFILDDPTWRRLMRPLAIWHLYALTGGVLDAHQKAREAAIEELKQIRDGAFPLPVAGSTSAGSAAGGWGGDTRVSLR
jgi:hypothetical protein